MLYCISDIHGDLERFNKMLELIRFDKNDTLYIIGDVIDRGSSGVDILKRIMKTSNMIMIKGNHEQMCLDTLDTKHVVGARQLWQQNGGENTRQELLYVCESRERIEILNFLRKLPDHLDVVLNGQAYHLVHGFPSENDPHVRIWGRPESAEQRVYEDKIVIVGHTPTCFLTNDFDRPFSIVYGYRLIDIDCGCGGAYKNSRLACLRLEDLKEFYV